MEIWSCEIDVRPVDASVCCCVFFFFFFSSRRRHTRSLCDWSSDVCSSDLSALSRASGEGHCSGACAFIPQDIRPTIMRAYEESDRKSVV